MKSTGMVRKVDTLGRIVLPMELRKILDISDKESIEIYTDGNKIILKKHETACTFCQSSDTLTAFKGHNICTSCLAELKK